MTTFHLISLFPESFESYLNASILKRAQEKGLVTVRHYNPRDFAEGKDGRKAETYAERRVDGRPYGGGPGMVIEALPVMKAIDAVIGKLLKSGTGARSQRSKSATDRSSAKKAGSKSTKSSIEIIFFSPAGKQFTNEMAEKLKKYTDIVFVCGRYEGIDARVKKAFPMADISVGPYVLTGGELPAMIVIDAITRRIPGVLGHDSSIEETRIASPDVYTRPESIIFKGKKYKVPKILLSGHHARMDEWKTIRQGKAKR